MHSVIAMMGWPEIIGIVSVLLIILYANEIVEMLKGAKRVDEAEGTAASNGERKAIRLLPYIFWLIVALVVVMCAAGLGQL